MSGGHYDVDPGAEPPIYPLRLGRAELTLTGTIDLDPDTWTALRTVPTYQVTVIYGPKPCVTALDYLRASNRWPKPPPLVEVTIPAVRIELA